ncbi:hypothetical protein DID77_03155 [Candidatus Marinamargulisbacteria bacterium SCGC AG-439-L15]|nr:hypothetical protein DID77_03155 [Candidatus Marinamargulisbacteria bacterium SCGC AG-439-L15]
MGPKKDYGEAGKYLSLLFKLGFSMCLSIFLFFGLGLFLDKKFNTKGIFISIGVFLGIAGGFYFVYKEMTTLSKLDNQDDTN